MHEYARHTLLLTGTPNRADNQRLILADYEPHPTDPKREVLVHHAEAKYSNGIAEGYLRKFEMRLTNARVSKRTLADDVGRGTASSSTTCPTTAANSYPCSGTRRPGSPSSTTS